MLRLLKQIILFIYLLLFRRKQRTKIANALGCKKREKRHVLNIPEIPSSIDSVVDLPNGWRDTISFVGFNNDGFCARIEVDRFRQKVLTLFDLDIPGIGEFHFKDDRRGTRNSRDNLSLSDKIVINTLQPMRRWRICFRGSLYCSSKSRENVHAIASFYWQCLTDPYDFIATPSCWDIARSLSVITWKDLGSLCLQNIIWYQQWGELRGTISIEGQDDLEIRLKTVRERFLSCQTSRPFQSICSQHFVLEDSGHSFSANAVTFNDQRTAYFGFTTFPIGDSYPVEVRKKSPRSDEDGSPAFAFPHTLKACQETYHVTEKMEKACFYHLHSINCRCIHSKVCACAHLNGYMYKFLNVNDRFAYGIQLSVDETVQNLSDGQVTIDDSIAEDQKIDNALIVSLDQPVCKSQDLVGGKACQLSSLISLKDLNVPKGVCLTVNAMREHTYENIELLNAIGNIELSLKKLQAESLKLACQRAVQLFCIKPLAPKLETLIKSHLKSVFGEENWENEKFAVRSSSLGEDSVDSSSAGLMETFLSIQGFDNIVDAVRRCWASSVSYQCVEYRRQNGQNLFESMGVIIQEMVDSDVAGVLFTNDPVTGSESKMIINATFGLGELVVSGKVTPDNIVIKRTGDDGVEIEAISIGEKPTNLISDSQIGITPEERNMIHGEDLCLSENDIFRICQQGIYIESVLNCAQDIEWAISKRTLYILQSRPITVYGVDVDEEIIQELDSSVVSNNVLITTANIQEMMPGAVSTLTSDLFVGACERSLKYYSHDRLELRAPVHASTSAFTFSGIPMLHLTPSCVGAINSIGGEKSKSNVEIFVVGQTVKEHTLEMIRNYYGRRKKHICKRVWTILLNLLIREKGDSRLFDYYQSITDTFSVGEGTKTAEELYECIDDKLFNYFHMWRAYIYKAGRSSFWSGLIMSFLKGQSEDMDIDKLADMALILSECKDVYSAEVPLAVKRLAKLIAYSTMRDQFMDTPSEECSLLLKSTENEEIRSEFARFIERHGHRGIREAEFLEKSWSQNSSDLMNSLKLIIKQGTFEESPTLNKTVNEIVESLKTPLSYFKKMLLKSFLVKKAMGGVCSRELGKSVCIRFSNIFKQAYWKLANFMVCESRLPDQKLLFFFTHAEIGELLERRSAKLVRLAKRRMKVYQKMNDTKFPKVSIGLPKPLRQDSQNIMSTDSTLHGMPVCRGKAKGRACVIKSLEDADRIRDGDILVCRYTDVGWSPYFPLIRGLVTELGGLLSHGAVVARECGIPCLVNVPGATDLVRTGDIVLLDGSAGTFGKLVA